jgi:hypothetical protein
LGFSSYLEPNDELWIGLNDIRMQMYFEWSDGTPVTFTKWLRGEPSHENNRQEDCVVMKGKVRQLYRHLVKSQGTFLLSCSLNVFVQIVPILGKLIFDQSSTKIQIQFLEVLSIF